MRFNPPPGWPVPPEDWIPGPDWVPDPSWPPAPPGWQLLIEDAVSGPVGAPRRSPHPSMRFWLPISILLVTALLVVAGLVYHHVSNTSTANPASTAAAPSGTAPSQMTFGKVHLVAPDGWRAREPSGGTLTPPLVELAPDPDAKESIAIWSRAAGADPSDSIDSMQRDGMGAATTFGGKLVWTYRVGHTISSRDDNKYLLTWYITVWGGTRVDISCDTLDDERATAKLAPTCEEFVRSVVIAS